ncbi:MAG: Hsp70 family protein, partial [Pseudomonas caspiana]
VKIYQGESRWVRDNLFLGEMDIAVPPAPPGQIELDVRFTYDNNGLLEAQVQIPMTGEKRHLVIENNPGVLEPQEIKARLAALADLKIHPREQQVNSLLIARLERLYQESLGELRIKLDQMASHFQYVLEGQDERQIRETRVEMTQHLDGIEQGLWQ